MKVSSEDTGSREVVLTIEPDEEQIEQARQRAARQLSRYRPIPGFRPGRAPVALVERVYGADLVLEEAVHSVAEDLVRNALQEAELEPYDLGSLEIESSEPLTLKIQVSLAPVVELADYRSLRIEPEPEAAVTDEMVNARLEEMREQESEYQPVERPVLSQDRVTLAMTAKVDGETVYESDSYEITISIEEQPVMLVEALLGMLPGESTDRRIEFPDDYGIQDLAGKMADVSLTVKQIYEKVLPELNDEFAKQVSDFETLDELRADIRQWLQQELEDQRRTRLIDRAITTLVEHSTIEFPSAMVEDEIEHELAQRRRRLEGMGYTWELYLRLANRTEAQVRGEMRPEVEKRLSQQLALAEFSRSEGISISDEEVQQELERVTAETSEEARQRFAASGGLEAIRDVLLANRAAERLVEILTSPEPATEGTGSEESASSAEAAPEEVAPVADIEGAAQPPTEEGTSGEADESGDEEHA